MKLASRFAVAIVLVWLQACATHSGPPPARFVNESIGIASDFSADWLLVTDRESAPSPLKPQFPANKGPNDSPLMFGLHSDGSAFARVLVEPVAADMSGIRFFQLLYRVLGQQLEVYEARVARGYDAVRWTYRDPSVPTPVTYVETVTVRNGYGVRIGFWTLSHLLSENEAEFERLTDAWLFGNESGTNWEPSWIGLTESLETRGLEFVRLTRPPTTELTCPEGQRPLMWDVTGPNGRLHLFGSIHLGRKDFYPLAPEIEAAFESSQSLIVEIDVTQPGVQQETQKLMQEFGTLPVGTSIEDEISPGAYARLKESFESLGLPMDRFHGFKPWSLSMILSVFKFQSLGYADEFGVDLYFLKRAGDREVLSIESVREQFQILDSLDGELFLGYTLASLGMLDDIATRLIRSWRCGDAEALETLLIDSPMLQLPDTDALMETMFYERNQRMADFAAAQLEVPGEHFLVVGAGHMVGERGVPALLSARGFEVTPR